MAQISSTIVNGNLRDMVFNTLDMTAHDFTKINDRQYGIILTDLNGNERYVRVGVIVAEEREDMTARELMNIEVQKYTAAQEKKQAAAAAKAEKIKRDEKKRAEKKRKEEEQKNEDAA